MRDLWRPGTRTMVWAATCATVAACVAPATTPCADGSLCAPSDVCAPSGQGCADRDQVEACQDLGPDEPCDLGPLGVGLCTDGVCVPSGCGNEALELGEACDDGNRVSGDGCRADCGKVEVCGDQVLDDGEACDDGNLNDADACSDACAAVVWSASSRLAGAPQGTDVGLVHPIGVAFDLHGNVYVAETNGSRIRRVDGGTGEIVVVAGTGTHGYDGDGGPATAARIGAPHGLVLDGLGNLFFADAAMRVVRRVDAATGRISTIAGTGASGSSGDGGPASAARFIEPSGLELDGLGALYVSDAGAHRVRKIAGGVITTIAGTGTSGGSGDGGPAISAQLSGPRGLAVAADGTLYVSDPGNDRLRVIAPDGQIASLAAGEGLTNPADVALAPDGTPLVLDYDRARVYRVDRATGDLSAVVGDGGIAFAGDGGPATAARLAYPSGLAADGRGRLAIADTVNQRIRLVDEDGVISTIIGDGHLGDTGDDGAATSALLRRPVGMAVGADGALYIADTEQHSVRRVDPDGVITTIAGTGRGSFGGDGGPATGAGLDLPSQLALDGDGGLLIADRANHRVRRLDLATGIISTIAGTGSAGSAGDGGDATAATLREPTGVAVGPDGTIYVSDTGSHRVRQIVDGTITAVAGTGSAGSAGDGGAPTSAQLNLPTGLAVGADGALYIADRGNDRVRRIGDGVITSIAGPGPGEGGLDGPCGVAVDASDRVFVADTLRHRVVRVEPGGAVTVIAGQGYSGFFGDGGPATGSALVWPQGVALAPSGELYIVDTYRGFIRRIDADDRITTVAGQVDPPGGGPLAQARLASPRALVLGAPFTLLAGGVSGTVQALRTGGDRLETVIGRYPNDAATGDLARLRRANFSTVEGVAYDHAAQRIFLTRDNTIDVVTWTDRDDVLTWRIAPLTNPFNNQGHVDGALAAARFDHPTGLTFDEVTRVLYVADTGNHVIRAIDIDAGEITTVAGTPRVRGDFGDGLLATEALLHAPTATALGPAGELYVADTGNHRVRKVEPAAGLISTVLGDGVAASSGEGAPATSFPVDTPSGLACDARGNLYVSSTTTVRQVVADDDGVVDGSGAVRTIFGAPPRDTFPASAASCVTGVAVVDDTTVWAVDACAGLLLELRRSADASDG